MISSDISAQISYKMGLQRWGGLPQTLENGSRSRAGLKPEWKGLKRENERRNESR